jgi:hypothetical protein
MTIYEKRTYSITPGKMSEIARLYTDEGWPVFEAGGFGAVGSKAITGIRCSNADNGAPGLMKVLHTIFKLYLPNLDKPVLLKRRTPQITKYKHQMTNKFQIINPQNSKQDQKPFD